MCDNSSITTASNNSNNNNNSCTGNWRTQQYRDNIIAKLNSHIAATVDVAQQPLRTDARQMEANIYQKARSEHEYMAYIARLLVYIRDKSRKDVTKDSEENHKQELDDGRSPTADDTTRTAGQQSISPSSRIFSNYNIVETRNDMPQPSTTASHTFVNGSSSGIHDTSGPGLLEPNANQKLHILKNAIATVLQNPGWRSSEASANAVLRRPQLQLFGQYVAAQLAQIDDEAVLINTQQKMLALLNKAV